MNDGPAHRFGLRMAGSEVGVDRLAEFVLNELLRGRKIRFEKLLCVASVGGAR